MDEEEPKPRRCSNPNCENPDKTEADFHKHKNGLRSWCKACVKQNFLEWRREHPEHGRAVTKRWRGKNLEQARKVDREKKRAAFEEQRARKYGISVEAQRVLWRTQLGKCLICGDTLEYRKAHLDHDHASNRVRGFLCGDCNHAIGQLKEDPKRIRRAAAYVQAFQSNHPDPHTLLLNLRSIGGF